ncbi:receptor-like protein EIX2 [Rosa chinensis]|nr:receptor-like protein EIX2 [Rosa chinensis]
MSGRSMHSVLVGLVCLAIASAISCSSVGSSYNIMCLESERQALLQFKQGLVDESNALASWKSEKDCCKWRGIACNNQTGHVTGLNFSFSYDSYFNYSEVPLRGAMSPSLLELPFVNYLDLSYNDFEGIVIPKLIGSLSQLKELKLAHANFSGLVPPQLGNLSNLHTLDLSRNYDATNVSSNFVHIDLSHSQLEGPIPDVFTSMLSLVTLDLSWNKLEGGIPKGFQNLCSLESLTLWSNQLSENIEDSVKTLSCAENTLMTLDLSYNQFWGSWPDLARFSKLRELHLGKNQLNGYVPASVGQLSSLEHLSLSGNSFTGVITESHFLKLSRLHYLGLSGNYFSINLSSDWNPPFQLTGLLDMSSYKLGPAFPKWILTQTNLTGLYLSNAGLSGSLPNKFWDIFSGLFQLDLSMNQIHGKLPNLSTMSLSNVYLSSNLLSGAVPSFSPELRKLYLSNNKFSEPLSCFCATQAPYLGLIDISENQLSGELPNYWKQFQGLEALKLEKNKLSGKIPSSLGNLKRLTLLSLNANNFSGELPSLENCTNTTSIMASDNSFGLSSDEVGRCC